MRPTLIACVLWAGFARAQTAPHSPEQPHWEIGASGGFGWTNDLTVSGPAGSATTGLKAGGAVGAWGGEDGDRFGGEARYLYRFSDFKLSQGSSSVTFGGHEHIAEGAILYNFKPRTAHVRPFFSFGGGLKILIGSGVESAGQPLGKFAALTATREVLPTADAGFGFKVNLKEHLRLRVEVRDYISGAPNKVIAPAPGYSLGGVMNDITGLAGLSYVW